MNFGTGELDELQTVTLEIKFCLLNFLFRSLSANITPEIVRPMLQKALGAGRAGERAPSA